MAIFHDSLTVGLIQSFISFYQRALPIYKVSQVFNEKSLQIQDPSLYLKPFSVAKYNQGTLRKLSHLIKYIVIILTLLLLRSCDVPGLSICSELLQSPTLLLCFHLIKCGTFLYLLWNTISQFAISPSLSHESSLPVLMLNRMSKTYPD